MKSKTPPVREKKREQKSAADEKLGGQPENDKDARDLGFESSTSEAMPQKGASESEGRHQPEHRR